MRLKLNLVRPGDHPPVDLLVTTDATVTVGELAKVLRERDPVASQAGASLTMGSWNGTSYQPMRTGATLAEAGVRSGAAVVLLPTVAEPSVSEGVSAGTVRVVAGPDSGKQFALRSGANEVGRAPDNEVVLTDVFTSKKHLRINVTDAVEVVDLGSSNGVQVGGVSVPRAFVKAEDDVTLGDTVLRISRTHTGLASSAGATSEAFVRSPRLDPVWAGPKLLLPELPERPKPERLPLIAMLVPILMGGVLFAITKQVASLAFIALTPMMMLGTYFESRWSTKRAYKEAVEAFDSEVGHLREQLLGLQETERRARSDERPSTGAVVEALLQRESLLWSRRPDRDGWLQLRLGSGPQPSRTTVELPSTKPGEPQHWRKLTELVDAAAVVVPVPVIGDLAVCGALGVAGPRPTSLPVARALVLQLVGLHSPAELVLCSLASTASAKDWDWLKWLPHAHSDHSPLEVDHLAAGAGQGALLLNALEELYDARGDAEVEPGVEVLVLVEDDNGCDRSRIVELAERGPARGIRVLWRADATAALPAACGVYVSLSGNSDDPATVGDVASGRTVEIAAERLSAEESVQCARSLAPLMDAGARVQDDSDLPSTVSAVRLSGPELAQAPDAVVDLWRTGGSLTGSDGGARAKSGLRATVGMGAGQKLVLDLREQGPHALVGGTTGSGKSEFLQAWVMGMAAEHSPSRVTFLFVDYKGGAAFSECTRLPHCVGLVTDLSPHLVRRALTSLNAELRHREHILQRKKAKDLFELERRGDPEAPPSLVIVVDEFAALVHEVPEFVDGVVNVAQRGRSLGLNLILATQRPAGVIKDNLRANTNLRVALRMADEGDSEDVVGTKVAAGFSPAIPGRAVVKTGPGRLTPFQSAYVGGWTTDTPAPPAIDIRLLGFGALEAWEPLPDDDAPEPTGPNDLTRLVDNVRAAHAATGRPAPRRPWLDPLAEHYDITKSPPTRSDTELVFGIADDPDRQVQRPVAFHPDVDGNMAVFGTGGVGKSTFLRTLALAAGSATRDGRCHVYGLDFGSRGLAMLDGLPHVGAIVNGDDEERVFRLVRHLRALVDERLTKYADLNASTITEYRKLAGKPDEARVLLLVDNLGAFEQAYTIGDRAKLFDTFASLAADGRPVGVHVVLSADRMNAVPTSLNSLVQRTLVLRLASENDYSAVSVGQDILESAPAGRGVFDGFETQVLVMGTSRSTADQALLVSSFGERLAGMLEPSIRPAPIGKLADIITLAELPVEVGGWPAVGVADDDLLPVGLPMDEVIVLAGAPQSGRSTVLRTILKAAERRRPGRRVHFGFGQSAVQAGLTWDHSATGVEAVAASARKLTEDLAAWHTTATPLTIVIEELPEFLNTDADYPLQDLLKACRANGVFVIAEGEVSTMTSSWDLMLLARASRTGILLQPEQMEGENLFKTDLPRYSRGQFPPGRGIYVRSGRVRRIQFALPELEVGTSPPTAHR